MQQRRRARGDGQQVGGVEQCVRPSCPGAVRAHRLSPDGERDHVVAYLPERRVALHRVVLVGKKDHAEVAPRHDEHPRDVVLHVAVVRHHGLAVAPAVSAPAHPVERVAARVGHAIEDHAVDAGGRHHAAAAVQVHPQVRSHVVDARAHIARRRSAPGVVAALMGEAVGHGKAEPVPVACRRGGAGRLPVKGGVAHPQGAEHVGTQVLTEPHAAHVLDDAAEQVVVRVRVAELACVLPHLRAVKRLVVAEATRLVEQRAHRNRVGNAELGRVERGRGVEVDEAFVDELLHRRRRHGLGERADDEGVVRRADVAHHALIANTLRVDDGDGQAGDAGVGKKLVEVGVDRCLELRRVGLAAHGGGTHKRRVDLLDGVGGVRVVGQKRLVRDGGMRWNRPYTTRDCDNGYLGKRARKPAECMVVLSRTRHR